MKRLSRRCGRYLQVNLTAAPGRFDPRGAEGRPLPGRVVKAGQRSRGPARRLSLLPTAGGGIARAAHARALAAGLDVHGLLRNAGLTPSQIAKADARFPVKNQIRFLNDVAAA